jgi:hypothetical protein
MDSLSKAFYRIAPEEKAAYEERLRSQGLPEAEISSLRNSDFTRARYVTGLQPSSFCPSDSGLGCSLLMLCTHRCTEASVHMTAVCDMHLAQGLRTLHPIQGRHPGRFERHAPGQLAVS